MQKLFSSVLLFILCLVFGFITWFFVTPKERVSEQSLDQSSMAAAELYRYDYDTSAVSAQTLSNNLNQLNESWYKESSNPERAGFVLTPQQLKESLQAGMSALNMSNEQALEFEHPSRCTDARLWLENDISNNSEIADLIENREESTLLPRKCVTFTINKFNSKPERLAQCPDRAGLPLPLGEKACTTKNLVNLTYNSYVDVMDCFGFNPKNILPKLANESGMVINALGGGFDAGVAQMTITGINFVNAEYANYMAQMAASTKPACVRLMKHKNLLTQASELKKDRCGFITPAENPLRSFVYSAVLNKINETEMRKLFEQHNIESRIKALGFKNVNIDSLIEIMAYMSYNAGSDIAFNAVKTYVDKREANNMPISAFDFNFLQQRTAIDLDSNNVDVHVIARAFVSSPLTIPGEDGDMELKFKRAKLLPEKIRNAYRLTFPEYLIYKQNNFNEADSTIGADYRILGSPGYIGFLAKKNKVNRETFTELRLGADYCSNPNYLKLSK